MGVTTSFLLAMMFIVSGSLILLFATRALLLDAGNVPENGVRKRY